MIRNQSLPVVDHDAERDPLRTRFGGGREGYVLTKHERHIGIRFVPEHEVAFPTIHLVSSRCAPKLGSDRIGLKP